LKRRKLIHLLEFFVCLRQARLCPWMNGGCGRRPVRGEQKRAHGHARGAPGKTSLLVLSVLFFCLMNAYAQNSKQGGTLDQWLFYAQKGDYDKAIVELNKIIKIYPDSADSYYNRGTLYAEEGKFDQAIADCSKAIEINPNYADAYYNRAVAYFSKKEYDKAWEDVYQAQRLRYEVNSRFLEMLRKASGRQQ
jgi:tetratricopeptide (TPR) repeat protein